MAASNMAGSNPAGQSLRATNPSLALAAVALYKTLSAPSRCLGTIFPPEARAVWRSFLKGEIMSLSGSNDRPVPEGANPVLSGAAGSRKAAERLRLAKALRANLGRRKAQKIDRRKLTGDAAESKTGRGEGAQSGANSIQD
jgi:hypothetical protein